MTTHARIVLLGLRGILLTAASCLTIYASSSPAVGLPELQRNPARRHIELDTGWRTSQAEAGATDPSGWTENDFDERAWREVAVPHNWDVYAGTRGVRHGNLHGSAWYRRRFTIDPDAAGTRRFFLFFEGVSSYATVWLNGKAVGKHAGGLTTFTLDITDAVRQEGPNLLAVRVDHPAGIRDLPWVCGGCELAYGFSEGSQPFGIFRPVHLVTTDSLRIDPFGVHVWNDKTLSAVSATAHIAVELTNHGSDARRFTVVSSIIDSAGNVAATGQVQQTLASNEKRKVNLPVLTVSAPQLWSLYTPSLYTVRTELRSSEGGGLIDQLDTPFGFRSIEWPRGAAASRGTLLVNGQPVFLNGTCEYPHLLGNSHAFGPEQIRARVGQIEAAGFNAFRDAHHPHDLRYQGYWDRDGVAWWTQFGAHIWFDRDDFRENYLTLLRDWVRERRNSPSLILWGLQNESQLPADFAERCVALIRQMDPTASDQRLVTTCNGGAGTDWDVPQNWSGTYGGKPEEYANELKNQILVGEYGAWRSLGLHAAAGSRAEQGYDEEHFNSLLETKLRLANSVRDRAAGQFHWLFSTHENPGRNFGAKGEQLTDGWGTLDRLGAANNKGLLTLWGEPTDAYYLFRSNLVSGATQPMVVIAGSTSTDRVAQPNSPPDVIVYSNCDEVELFTGGHRSLGLGKRAGIGSHFEWNDLTVSRGELTAVGRRQGKTVAHDSIFLASLPRNELTGATDTTAPLEGMTYLYRVNCGGPALTDVHGNRWEADHDFRDGDAWGCLSWTEDYAHLIPGLGSIRRVDVPISRTQDPGLYQRFRYGRERLKYVFAVPDGEYRVELHFAEPWYGRGGIDATGWRIFDVAINGRPVLRDFDLSREGGYAQAVRKVVTGQAVNGRLEITFPRIGSYQAVISAIAIAAGRPAIEGAPHNREIVRNVKGARLENWLDAGDLAYGASAETLFRIPESLKQQPWLKRSRTPSATLGFTLAREADLWAAFPVGSTPPPGWETTAETITVLGIQPVVLTLLRQHGAANQLFNFADTSPELIILTPTRPLAPAQFIRNLRVENSSEPAGWQPAGSLQRGERVQGPAGPALSQLPAELTDADWLRTPANESAKNLSVYFEAVDPLEVIVGLSSTENAPAWMEDWLPWPNQTAVLGTQPLKLFRCRFEAGATVKLGANNSRPANQTPAMYAVFARAVRPSISYPATHARGGSFELNKPDEHADWTIAVGVGDRYGFVIPWRPREPGSRQLRYDFTDKAGKVLCTQAATFTNERTDRDGWTRWRLRTCESVNAGTYSVRVTLVSGSSTEFGPITVE